MSMDSSPERPFLPFNHRGEIERTTNRLVHWEQAGRAYFITFRLADSLPAELLAEWECERADWLRAHPSPWTPDVESEYQRRFSARIEHALDEGHGRCVLKRADHAAVVGEALKFFEGERYLQLAWVVMPNHVHALLAPLEGWSLEKILHSWKSYTAKRINASLETGGRFWQKDYFDRLVRDDSHFRNCVRYIRRNPRKSGLREGEYLHWESPLAQGVG